MESSNLVLTCEEFARVSGPEFAKLTPAELRDLTADPKKRLALELQKAFTFVPQVSAQSARYAERKRIQLSTPKELSDRLHREHQLQLAEKRRSAEEAKLRERKKCSFAPEVHEIQPGVFDSVPQDALVYDYVASKGRSKEKAKKIQVAVRRQKMNV